jgi:ATP-dependent DNA ligase
MEILVPRVICTGHNHLYEVVQSVINTGGEGVILQHLNSPYQHGRTTNLLKIKVTRLYTIYIYILCFIFWFLVFLMEHV